MLFSAAFALAVLCASSVQGARLPGSKLPRWVTACYRDDPKLNECALKNGQEALPGLIKGDRKFRVPVLDPMHIVEISLDRKATNLGLDIHMRDVTLVGLKDTILKDINIDLKGEQISFTVLIPNLQILSTYNVSGQILILPVRGSGPGNITLLDTSCTYKVEYDLEKSAKDGKEYIKLVEHRLSFETKKAVIKLDNLFNGDRLLGDSMNRFMNENWKDLVNEVGPAIANALGEVMTQILEILAEQVPYDDVVPWTPKKSA